LARQAAARRVVPAVWSAWSSGHPHSEAASVRRDAAVAPSSCFRQAEGQPSAALSEPAWWQAPAAWRQTAGAAAAQVMASPSEMKAAAVVAESVRPVALAPQARLPVEEAAVASGAKVRPQAEAELAPSVQQPVEAAAVSGVGVVLPPEVAGVALDAAAEPQQVVAAAARLDAEVLRPGAGEEPAPSARQPAERPSALPSWRLGGHPRPWLAPRQ
jgi:hypothetical protein